MEQKLFTVRKKVQIALVCAIALERDAVRQVFNKYQEGFKQQKFKENRTKDGYLYHSLIMNDNDGNKIEVLLFTVEIMGGVVSPQRAIEIIEEFKPNFMIMPGVCGGRDGEVNLGDVIVADRVFSLEGKTTAEGIKYDTRTIQVKEQLLGYINSLVGPEYNEWNKYVVVESPQMKSFKKDKVLSLIFDKDGIAVEEFQKEAVQFLSEEEFLQIVWNELHDKEKMFEMKDNVLRLTAQGKEYVRKNKVRNPTWPKEPKITIQAHSGPMAISPDGVRSDMTKEKWESISKFQRKVLGVEMEGYGLFSAISRYNENNNHADKHRCEVLLVKGVMDYALNKESDDYKMYAAQTSASWVLEFSLKYAVMSCVGSNWNEPSHSDVASLVSKMGFECGFIMYLQNFLVVAKEDENFVINVKENIQEHLDKLNSLLKWSKLHETVTHVDGDVVVSIVKAMDETYPGLQNLFGIQLCIGKIDKIIYTIHHLIKMAPPEDIFKNVAKDIDTAQSFINIAKTKKLLSPEAAERALQILLIFSSPEVWQIDQHQRLLMWEELKSITNV